MLHLLFDSAHMPQVKNNFMFRGVYVYLLQILSGDVLVLTALMSGGKHVERMARLLVNLSGRKFSC